MPLVLELKKKYFLLKCAILLHSNLAIVGALLWLRWELNCQQHET